MHHCWEYEIMDNIYNIIWYWSTIVTSLYLSHSVILSITHITTNTKSTHTLPLLCHSSPYTHNLANTYHADSSVGNTTRGINLYYKLQQNYFPSLSLLSLLNLTTHEDDILLVGRLMVFHFLPGDLIEELKKIGHTSTLLEATSTEGK